MIGMTFTFSWICSCFPNLSRHAISCSSAVIPSWPSSMTVSSSLAILSAEIYNDHSLALFVTSLSSSLSILNSVRRMCSVRLKSKRSAYTGITMYSSGSSWSYPDVDLFFIFCLWFVYAPTQFSLVLWPNVASSILLALCVLLAFKSPSCFSFRSSVMVFI